jgi:hypothetical protein
MTLMPETLSRDDHKNLFCPLVLSQLVEVFRDKSQAILPDPLTFAASPTSRQGKLNCAAEMPLPHHSTDRRAPFFRETVDNVQYSASI